MGWALVIFVLCATPGQYIPSADWLELLSFDKFVHASMFFILSSLTLISTFKYHQANSLVFLFWGLCICYGALLEVLQATCFSNRSADGKDMVANAFGCFVALFFIRKFRGLVASALIAKN